MDRNRKIARKEMVRREIMRVRNEINSLNMGGNRQSMKRTKKQVRHLEARLDKLMAEESSLRIEIDKTAPDAAEPVQSWARPGACPGPRPGNAPGGPGCLWAGTDRGLLPSDVLQTGLSQYLGDGACQVRVRMKTRVRK